MPEVIQLGPLMIKLEWLILAVSGYAGYLAMKMVLKKNDYEDKHIFDLISNGFLIIFLVWKFSPLIFTPSILWQYPAGILMMPGSEAGGWLGILLALWYCDRRLPKIGIQRLWFADLLVIGMVAAIFVHSLSGWQYGKLTTLAWGISIENPDYKYHPVNVYIGIITAVMLLWMNNNRSLFGTGKMTLHFLTYYSTGLMLITLFRPKLATIFFDISTEQFIYLALMATGFILSIKWNNKKSD